MWCVPQLDDEFIERMEDILDLYQRPYDARQPLVAFDERPTVLHDDKRVGLPLKPGKPARRDYEYVRKGAVNIFCATEPLVGKHITRVTPNRSGREFAKFLAHIARRYPDAATIHLVLDNLSTHAKSSLVAQYGQEHADVLWKRFTFHYTPRHGSWLNLAELEISILNRQCLGRRRIPSIEELRHHVRAWNRRANRDRTRVCWRFTSEDARQKFGYTRS